MTRDEFLEVPATQAEVDAILDDLLTRWHDWKQGYRFAREYGGDAAFRDAKSEWSAYDRDNGVPEEDYERSQMKAVDRAVERIPNHPQAWHTAILFEARNLAAGAQVWSSFRLPQSSEELQVLRLEARTMLLKELRREGLMGT